MLGCEQALLILEMDKLGYDPVYAKDLISDYALRLLQTGVVMNAPSNAIHEPLWKLCPVRTRTESADEPI